MTTKPSGRRQTEEQKRAKQALEDVRSVIDRNWASKYRSLVEGFPAMVLMNGLGQALAFIRSRFPERQGQENEYMYFYHHLARWVPGQVRGLDGDLLDALMRADVGTYRWAQVEALAYVQWLKRFAQAMIPKEGEER